MAGEMRTNPAGILRDVKTIIGSINFTHELGTDDYLKAWPVQPGEIERILFRPHSWLRAAVPEWYRNIALSDQITVIFSYPDLPESDSVTPYVEVVRERPLVTVRCPPSSAIMRELRSRPKADPAGQLDLVLYKGARLAYGHYEISDQQGEIEQVILAMIADPKTYIDAIGAANTDPAIKFRAVDRLQEIRFICQFKSAQATAPSIPPDETPDDNTDDAPDKKPDDVPDVTPPPPDDTPELPTCTMFTGTYDPDTTDSDKGTVAVDTVWAADWPPPPPPPPVPDPDPTPPDPP